MMDRLCPYCGSPISIQVAGIAPSFRFKDCTACKKTYRIVDMPKKETIAISEEEFRRTYNQGNLSWNGKCWHLGNLKPIELKTGDTIELLNEEGTWDKQVFDPNFQSVWPVKNGEVLNTPITARKA